MESSKVFQNAKLWPNPTHFADKNQDPTQIWGSNAYTTSLDGTKTISSQSVAEMFKHSPSPLCGPLATW